MSFRTPIVLAVLALGCAASADAQSVRVQFNNGLVSVSAQNAQVRQILAEWAKLGGTTFVNAERVAGAPVTLQLDNVSERHALDVLLRGVPGYMVAARPDGLVGASAFDRILIVPTSTAPPVNAGAPRPPQPSFQQPRLPMPIPIQPEPEVTFDPDDPEENPPDDIAPEEEPENDQPLNPRVRVPFVPPNITGRPQPFQPDPDVDAEPEEQPIAAPGNPFGVGPGASRPGTVTPVPQQRDRQPQPDPEP